MVERKPYKFKVTGSSPVFCAEFNVSCLYPQCSVTVAREIVALLEKVRLLPCGPNKSNEVEACLSQKAALLYTSCIATEEEC